MTPSRQSHSLCSSRPTRARVSNKESLQYWPATGTAVIGARLVLSLSRCKYSKLGRPLGAGAVTGCSCSMEGPDRKRRATDAGGSAQGGAQKRRLCEHKRRRSRCKDCGGSAICEHQRRRSSCKDCGGSGICEHQRRRSRCKDCGGSSICEHQRIRSTCKDCRARVADADESLPPGLEEL